MHKNHTQSTQAFKTWYQFGGVYFGSTCFSASNHDRRKGAAGIDELKVMLQGSLELSSGDLSHTQKRHLESVYIQHRNWTVLLDRKHSSRTNKAVPAFGIDCGGSDAVAEISLQSFYSCFSVSHAPPTPGHMLSWQRQTNKKKEYCVHCGIVIR